MKRKEITKFLSELLICRKFSGIGKYYAKEVSLDYGTKDVKRVDFMQFVPPNQTSVSSIEKGEFICYEVKSCKEDFKSGYGQNFVGERNYIVTTMETYKQIIREIPHGVGVIVAIPYGTDKNKEFENPTEITAETKCENWELYIIYSCKSKERKRSMTELLFCMLRAGK